jgi:hypothetical protein
MKPDGKREAHPDSTRTREDLAALVAYLRSLPRLADAPR